MADQDIERALEGAFSGDSPAGVFRARALNASVAAFYKGRKDHVRRRRVQFGLAAAFIAGASFLLGRGAAPSEVTSPPVPVATESVETVRVSRELVAWLEAANLFRQVGMQDRMARAVGRAGRLLPDDVETAASDTGAALAEYSPVEHGREKPLDWVGGGHVVASGECLNRILAQSLGD